LINFKKINCNHEAFSPRLSYGLLEDEWKRSEKINKLVVKLSR